MRQRKEPFQLCIYLVGRPGRITLHSLGAITDRACEALIGLNHTLARFDCESRDNIFPSVPQRSLVVIALVLELNSSIS